MLKIDSTVPENINEVAERYDRSADRNSHVKACLLI